MNKNMIIDAILKEFDIAVLPKEDVEKRLKDIQANFGILEQMSKLRSYSIMEHSMKMVCLKNIIRDALGFVADKMDF